MPGVPQTALLDANTLKPTFVTKYTAWWNGIHEAIETAGLGPWHHVVGSRVQDHVTLEVGVATPIVGLRQNSYIGSQNRRRGVV